MVYFLSVIFHFLYFIKWMNFGSRRPRGRKSNLTPLKDKLLDLYNTILNYTDSRGRTLSTPFVKLPSKNVSGSKDLDGCIPWSAIVHRITFWSCDVHPRWRGEWLFAVTEHNISRRNKAAYNMSTHWGRDKMAAIFQTFTNAFLWRKMFELRLRFHWSLFLRVQLTIVQHWFRLWLGAIQAPSHYLNRWWLVYWHI